MILKRSDYLEVGDISWREAREIIAISGPSLAYLILLAIASTLLALLAEKSLLLAFFIYIIIYPPIRLLTPHWSVTLAYLIPRASIRAYFLLSSATIMSVSIDYASIVRIALINERIKI